MFGANRIRNTPISEEVIVGAAIGAAMTGLRPIVDLSYSSLPVHGDGPVREPGRQEPLHVRRPGVDPGRVPLGDVLRAQHRRAPLRPAVPDVHERARPQDRRAGFAQRTRRACCARPSTRTTRCSSSRRACCGAPRRTSPRRSTSIPFGVGPHRCGRLRRHRRGGLQCGAGGRQGGRRSWPSEGISVEVIDPRTLVPLDVDGDHRGPCSAPGGWSSPTRRTDVQRRRRDLGDRRRGGVLRQPPRADPCG